MTSAVEQIAAGKTDRRWSQGGEVKWRWIHKAVAFAIYLCDGFKCVYCLRDLHSADTCALEAV